MPNQKMSVHRYKYRVKRNGLPVVAKKGEVECRKNNLLQRFTLLLLPDMPCRIRERNLRRKKCRTAHRINYNFRALPSTMERRCTYMNMYHILYHRVGSCGVVRSGHTQVIALIVILSHNVLPSV